ncbi:hypothetical protein BV25DRAFT_1833043, partial [Artomyces pyxidatus]
MPSWPNPRATRALIPRTGYSDLSPPPRHLGRRLALVALATTLCTGPHPLYCATARTTLSVLVVQDTSGPQLATSPSPRTRLSHRPIASPIRSRSRLALPHL